MKKFAWFHRLAGFVYVVVVVMLAGGSLAAASIYDIPRVPVKTPDAADWGDLGFRVAAMVDTRGVGWGGMTRGC
jgi:hypothetical protein